MILIALSATSLPAYAVSRYSQAKVTPIRKNGQTMGFRLSMVVIAEGTLHRTAWIGLFPGKEVLKAAGMASGFGIGKVVLYDKSRPEWLFSHVVEGLTETAPQEVRVDVLFKDHPQLKPGDTVQLGVVFPTEESKVKPSDWKHSFGVDWGGGWGEPSHTLPGDGKVEK